MDSLGVVVACGVEVEEFNVGSSKCWAYDGSNWVTLPDSTQQHCILDTPNSVVNQGWWVTGRVQLPECTLLSCCSQDQWTSEIFTGDEWIPGPQHPVGFSVYSCLVNVNSTHTLLTGGLSNETDPTMSASWLYDWTAGVWTETGHLNEGRIGHGCAVVEGQGVLIIGGLNGGDNLEPAVSVELYDPQTGIWTTQPDQYTPASLNLLFIITLKNSILGLFTGEDNVYERAEDGTWSALEGVVLPSAFNPFISKATLVPSDFSNGCM